MTMPWKWTYQQLSISDSQQVRFVSVGPRTLGHSAELPSSWTCVIGIGVFAFLISALEYLEIPWYVLIYKLGGAQIRIPVIEELAHKLAGR